MINAKKARDLSKQARQKLHEKERAAIAVVINEGVKQGLTEVKVQKGLSFETREFLIELGYNHYESEGQTVIYW